MTVPRDSDPPPQRGPSAEGDMPAFGRSDGESSFRDESATLFSKAMSQTRMALILADPHLPDCPIVFANRAFVELTGYPEDEIMGRNCRFLQGPKTDPDTVQKMREALQAEDVVVVKILNYRKDGSAFWNSLHLGPIYDESGRLQYYFGSQWNVSDIHTARQNEEQAMIAQELSHRVKNMFSIVSAVVSLTADRHGAAEVADDINARINALGRAHEVTLIEAKRENVGLGQLIASVLEPYSAGTDQCITLSGRYTTIELSQSSVIGLVIHDLATNAVKYGAFRSAEGSVAVHWERPEAAGVGLRIIWTETTPTPIHEPDRVGTGTGIIDTIIAASGGGIEREWRPEGLRAVISLPS